MPNANILVVEDQRRLALALSAILKEAKYQVDVVFDGRSGLEYALLADYEAIVLDVMLPEKTGFEVIAELRRAGKATPVILLTARDSLRDKIRGLDQGADDYLTKPFNPAELLARLRALTRRSGSVLVETLILGNTRLDLESAELSLLSATELQVLAPGGLGERDSEEDGNGSDSPSLAPSKTPRTAKLATAAAVSAPASSAGNESIRLTRREFEVLKLLMSGAGRIYPKQDILRRCWNEEDEVEENNVEAYISFLRKKLAHLGSNLAIVTLRQLGYRIEIYDAD